MNIVILGAGKMGSYLASVLSKEEHSVIVIDKDTKALEKLNRENDVSTLCGYGAQWKLLEDLIENDPALFIAITGEDETNLIACSIAKNLGYPNTIARVKEIGFLARSRLDFGRLFFVDHFIGAEVLAAHDILKSIISREDLIIENFAHGAIQMRSFKVPDTWKNQDTPIKDLALPEDLIIGLINREGKIIFPHGNDCIKGGDKISVIGETQGMYNIHSIFKTTESITSSVVIVGGSIVAVQLAHILESFDLKIKIIEKDENRCNELADLLPKSTILNHDGTDFYFLQAEQIQNNDAFISCTRRDDRNILLSLLAKQLGCNKVVSLISDISLSSPLRNLNINYSVSERVTAVNRILSIMHQEKIISVASLYENQAKVLEIKVSEDSKLVGIPLADLSSRLPKELLIAAIENRGRVVIGKGNRMISPNDTIIVIASPEHVHKLHDMF